MTFRQATFTANTGRGRPVKHGEIIRPLERVFNAKTLPASPADRERTWVELDEDGQELVLHASISCDLVFFEQKSWSVERLALNKSSLWRVMPVKHPNFEFPMLIVINVPEFTPVEAYQVVKARWGIEQAPLVSKQLLGAHRLFVHNAEMCYRLPELVFVAGAIPTYLARVIGAVAVGVVGYQTSSEHGAVTQSFIQSS